MELSASDKPEGSISDFLVGSVPKVVVEVVVEVEVVIATPVDEEVPQNPTATAMMRTFRTTRMKPTLGYH